jgi:hypothetical protein
MAAGPGGTLRDMSSPDSLRTVAALYVDERGPYVGLPAFRDLLLGLARSVAPLS